MSMYSDLEFWSVWRHVSLSVWSNTWAYYLRLVQNFVKILFIIRQVKKISNSYLIISWQRIQKADQSSHGSKPRSHSLRRIWVKASWAIEKSHAVAQARSSSGQKLAETNIKPEHNFHDRFQHWAPVRTPMPELGFKPDRAAYGIAVWAYDCLNLLETSLGFGTSSQVSLVRSQQFRDLEPIC